MYDAWNPDGDEDPIQETDITANNNVLVCDMIHVCLGLSTSGAKESPKKPGKAISLPMVESTHGT